MHFSNHKLLILSAAMSLAMLAYCGNAQAQSVEFGGQTCTQNYGLFDYYTGPNGTGTIYHTAWEPTGVSCTPTGGSGAVGWNPLGGGGGSTGAPTPVPGFPYRTVSFDGKNVVARDVQCGDALEDVTFRHQAAMHALIVKPNMPLGTVVTLHLYQNKTQKWAREQTSGSVQFKSVGACG